MNKCEVNVLDCIPEYVKIQAEAHELGHIYIRGIRHGVHKTATSCYGFCKYDSAVVQ